MRPATRRFYIPAFIKIWFLESEYYSVFDAEKTTVFLLECNKIETALSPESSTLVLQIGIGGGGN